MTDNLSVVAVGVSAESTAPYRQRSTRRYFAGSLLATTPRALSYDNRQVSAVLHEDSRHAHEGSQAIAQLEKPDMPGTQWF
jgi:hypothetical protein